MAKRQALVLAFKPNFKILLTQSPIYHQLVAKQQAILLLLELVLTMLKNNSFFLQLLLKSFEQHCLLGFILLAMVFTTLRLQDYILDDQTHYFGKCQCIC